MVAAQASWPRAALAQATFAPGVMARVPTPRRLAFVPVAPIRARQGHPPSPSSAASPATKFVVCPYVACCLYPSQVNLVMVLELSWIRHVVYLAAPAGCVVTLFTPLMPSSYIAASARWQGSPDTMLSLLPRSSLCSVPVASSDAHLRSSPVSCSSQHHVLRDTLSVVCRVLHVLTISNFQRSLLSATRNHATTTPSTTCVRA